MENFKNAITCYNCYLKVNMFDDRYQVYYECPERNYDEALVDHYCGKHPLKDNSDSYQQACCCYNCKHIFIYYQKNVKFYDCQIMSLTEGYCKLDHPDGICDFYMKDNGGIY